MSSISSAQAVEEIYQKKSQLEHIFLRPDSYIGSIEKETKVCLTVISKCLLISFISSSSLCGCGMLVLTAKDKW